MLSLAEFSQMDVDKFNEQYKVCNGKSGIMYILKGDSVDSELLFSLQGFIGGCLVVGPHII